MSAMEEAMHMRQEMNKADRVDGAQSVSRALTVLRAVARAGAEGVGLMTLTREISMSKPTIHRLLSVLVTEGMIEQEPQSRRYFLGPECHILGHIAAERHGIHRLATPIVQKLAYDCGDSAFFSIRRGVLALCTMREDGAFPLKTYVLAAGDRYPLGIGAGSLALLVALPDDEVDEALAVNEALINERYPTATMDEIRRQVAEARARGGIAINRGWVMSGSWGIGLAVKDAAGRLLGALSIAAVQSRMSPERLEELSVMLRQSARRLQRQHEAEQPAAQGAKEAGVRKARPAGARAAKVKASDTTDD